MNTSKANAAPPQPQGNANSLSRPMTFGEKLVGLNFNPSNDDKVSKAKKLCADLADLLYNDYNSPAEHSELQSKLYEHTIGEILNAQMNVVKVLTLKY